MKRIITIFLLSAFMLSLCSCRVIGADKITNGINAVLGSTEKKTVTESELDELISGQVVYVKSTEYIVQDEEYKALYPDMLQAILVNNGNDDIKNAVVAFVAWDKNNLPVKIKGNIDFSDGAYIKKVNYEDINLVPGSEFGDGYGLSIDEDNSIATFKAIVVSYETFDGTEWENPYFDGWSKMYEGIKYAEELTVEVVIEKDTTVSKIPQSVESKTDSAEAVEQLIAGQKVKVISTKYVVQHDEYKALYPDMLQAVVENNSDDDIKNMVIAFVAWDKNKLPVKIKGNYDFSGGSYVKEVSYDGVNLIPGKTYGSNSGLELDEDNNIEYIKAIVASYETFEGTEWKNPYYDSWTKCYSGMKYPE